MAVRSLVKWCVRVGFSILALASGSAMAQEAPEQTPERREGSPSDTAQPDAPPEQGADEEKEPTPEELVEELLARDQGEDDLSWLYSNTEESASPTGLVGKPVPVPALPEAGEGTPRVWDPRWRRFGIGHYILTGTGLAIGAASSFIPESRNKYRFENEVDEWGRKNLGFSDYDDGRWAQDTSDVLLSVAITYPFLIDSLVIMYWYRRSHDVAGQMALISAEALGVAAALQGPVAGLTSRERPYGRDCGTSIDPNLGHCANRRRYRSFFSGHTAMAFAAAGVSCSHHAYHDVLGDPAADALACGSTLLVAAGTGMMRIVGSQHYITDVAVGATVGTLSGVGIPWLLHYGPLAQVGSTEQAAVKFRLVPVSNGLGIGGEF